jgi:hypothetical protein
MVHYLLERLESLALATVVFSAVVFFSRVSTADQRRARGERWARDHLAYVAPEWTAAVDRQLARTRRTGFAFALLMLVPVILVAPFDRLGALCLAVAPAGIAVSRYLSLRSPMLAPGPRVARMVRARLTDYLPPRKRALMWVATLAGCLVTCAVWLHGGGWTTLAVAPVLAAGSLSVELAGRSLVALPEPAADAAHLYWQDAFRSDGICTGAAMSALAAALICVESGQLVADSGLTALLLTSGVGVLLMVAAAVGFLRDPFGVVHLRARLWPTLGAGQVLVPGADASA